jgi:DNA-binding NarL/FixJ family response regulator
MSYCKTHPRWAAFTARAEEMAALYRSGKKLREIAEIFGCTDKNVHACMKKIGVSYRDGGRIKLAAVRKAQRKARSEAISFERYGCPRS